jgi:hypothetical protein
MAEGRLHAKLALVTCGVLCAIFAAVAWSAVSGKSATADEPTHAVTGWFDLWRADYRLVPDMPALWEDWIALGMGPNALHYDLSKPEFQDYFTIRNRHEPLTWDVRMLYRVPETDGVAAVRRGRMMALVLGVGLAVLIGWWAGKLGGGGAAVAATFIFCWDPNFLGHAALAKNDVGISLLYLATIYALWRCGVALTWPEAVAAIVLVPVGVLTKYSGLMLGPVMLIVLTLRALDGRAWVILGRTVADRRRKLGAALAVCVATGLFTWGAIWTVYDFRFDAGPDGLRLDMSRFLTSLRNDEFNQRHVRPTPAELAAWVPPVSTRVVMFAEGHHLLPQAWLAGFIMTQSGLEPRLCFLDGEFHYGGRWQYFPLTAFYKAPLATILAVGLAAWIGLKALRGGVLRSPEARWSAIALVVPAGLYGAGALMSNVNFGLRMIFPLYPIVFIGVGVAVAKAWRWGGVLRVFIVLLAVGLAAETAAAYPNYINFFGIACGGREAGYSLLSDSNLDWGQDLPALAQWQAAHREVPLYLDYFGRCDPAAYGIVYFNLAGGYEYGPAPKTPDGPCEIAVCNTNLKLLEGGRAAPPAWFELIRYRQPETILNGTIFMYRVDSIGR